MTFCGFPSLKWNHGARPAEPACCFHSCEHEARARAGPYQFIYLSVSGSVGGVGSPRSMPEWGVSSWTHILSSTVERARACTSECECSRQPAEWLILSLPPRWPAQLCSNLIWEPLFWHVPLRRRDTSKGRGERSWSQIRYSWIIHVFFLPPLLGDTLVLAHSQLCVCHVFFFFSSRWSEEDGKKKAAFARRGLMVNPLASECFC